MLVGNRHYTHLAGSKPGRKSTGIVLNQDTDKTLYRTINHTMDHNRTMLQTVFAGIGQIKFFWQQHIQLNSAALPCTTDRICQMKVDLRAIESSVAFIDNIIKSKIFHCALQSISCSFPGFGITH